MVEIKKILFSNKLLFVTLLIAFVLSVHGVNWGSPEDWNPDQMAFRNFAYRPRLQLNPEYFLKPPFHTYFNFVLSIVPLSIVGEFLHFSPFVIQNIIFILSKLLTVFLFLSSIVLVYLISKKYYNQLAAQIISLLLATSAGVISFAHFLTADIPVMFWMLLSFYFSQKIYYSKKTSNYLLAGFFVGIAMATKYNGLIAVLGLVLFHFLKSPFKNWKKTIINKNLFLGLMMIFLGFIIGNPYAIFDYQHFKADFFYVLNTDKLYFNPASRLNFIPYIYKLSELIGYPCLILCCGCIIFSFILLLLNLKRKKDVGFISSFTVSIAYVLFFCFYGGDVPTRYLLPIIPFFIMVTGTFWKQFEKIPKLLLPILLFIIIYNLFCSYYVGKRFLDDPRMEFKVWTKTNIPVNTTIEISKYVPSWNLDNQIINMPFVTGRLIPFKQAVDNLSLQKQIDQNEGSNENFWYSAEALLQRHPDYIIIDSLYYRRFFNDREKNNYPQVYQFFSKLFNQNLLYKIIFNRKNKPIPNFIYPKDIDFLTNQITVFKRTY